jgi:hypothetical protein
MGFGERLLWNGARDLRTIVTYDGRFAEAAANAGLAVVQPR